MFAYRQLHLRLLAFLVMILSVSWFGLSSAQDLSDSCTQAQLLLNQNQPLLAIDVLSKTIQQVWNSVPLDVKKAVLVNEKAKAYGEYDARPDNVYKSGEIIRLYIEPVGLTRKKEGDHYVVAGAFDYTVAREDGTILIGKENFGRLDAKTKNFGTHDYVDFDYNFTGLKPGSYVIKTVIRDLTGSKITSVTTPVRIE
jgi:hypothetical protein